MRENLAGFAGGVVGTLVAVGIGAALPYHFGTNASAVIGGTGALIGWIIGYVSAA